MFAFHVDPQKNARKNASRILWNCTKKTQKKRGNDGKQVWCLLFPLFEANCDTKNSRFMCRSWRWHFCCSPSSNVSTRAKYIVSKLSASAARVVYAIFAQLVWLLIRRVIAASLSIYQFSSINVDWQICGVKNGGQSFLLLTKKRKIIFQFLFFLLQNKWPPFVDMCDGLSL